jgi:hypothetical protein
VAEFAASIESTWATLALRPMRDLFPFGASDAPHGAFTL